MDKPQRANKAEPSTGELVDIMTRMVQGNVYSTRLFNLQRQGRVGTNAPIDGSEAVVAGAASALNPQTDWVFPQYREQVALGRFGDDLIDYIVLYNMGHPAGGGYPHDINVFPYSISLATQIPHAVGMGWGMKLKGEHACSLVFFGDGSSSEGDFYESANLAGVRNAPVIFVLINNGWAISTPVAAQTRAESFAAKAHAFGFPGVQVDGGDPLAVRAAVATARERAVAGDGPTLIEAVTYRLGHHTTADDPTKYRDADEVARARERAPIARFRKYLDERALWSDDEHAAAVQQADERFDVAWERAQNTPLEPTDFFDNVYATQTPRMQRQRAEMIADLAERAQR